MKEFTGERRLLTAIIIAHIQDYVNAIIIGGDDFLTKLRSLREQDEKRQRKAEGKNHWKGKIKLGVLSRGERARYYIFDDTDEDYVFGFSFICRTILELDPGKMRKKIKELRKERIESIFGKKMRK